MKSSTAKPRKSGKGTVKPTLTAGQLYNRAQQALAFERYDAALECMRDALELEPENVEIIDAHGALLAELGRIDEALQVMNSVASHKATDTINSCIPSPCNIIINSSNCSSNRHE